MAIVYTLQYKTFNINDIEVVKKSIIEVKNHILLILPQNCQSAEWHPTKICTLLKQTWLRSYPNFRIRLIRLKV
jgi:hypothetical protein